MKKNKKNVKNENFVGLEEVNEDLKTAEY